MMLLNMFIVPYNMRIDRISWFIQDDDPGTTSDDTRLGIFTVASMAAEDTITQVTGNKDFTLKYISPAIENNAEDGYGYFDNNTSVNLDAGMGVFMGYINPDAGTFSDARSVNCTIWTNPR